MSGEFDLSKLLGKTSCFKNCDIGYKCFTGFLNDIPECNREYANVTESLTKATGQDTLYVKDSRFGVILRSPSDQPIDLVIKNGEIVKLN